MNVLKNSGLFMFRKSRQSIPIIAIFMLVFANGAFAQGTRQATSFFTSEIITIYFLMLLFATIINRLLEYLKLLLTVVDQRFEMFSKLGDSIFNAISQKMDRLGIYYDADKVRSNLRKYLIFAVIQFCAFVLGIFLAFLFKMDVLTQLQMSVGEPYGFILTGLIIGAGVDPVHSFFRIAQEKRKIKKLKTKAQSFIESPNRSSG